MTRYGYERVSTNEQNPEAQGDKLRAFGVDRIFTDKGVSGTRARRPQWDKLLATLQPGDALVTVRLDRIGRSVTNLLDVVAWLGQAGVELIVLDQPIDTSTPSGRLFLGMLAIIAEFERDLIIERTKDGQATVRRSGNLRRSLGGTPPLGFRVGDEDDDDWVPDTIAADWLRDAAGRVLNGEAVEAAFAELPAITDAAGRPVTVKMLRAALQRPASAGLIREEGGDIEAAVTAPLDAETFRRLEVLFGSRKRGRPVETGKYPFGPILRCGKCGNQLTGGPGYRGRDYYACKNPHKALGVLKPCRGVSIAAEDVHELFRRAVMVWAASPAARLAAARTPETASRRAELEARIAEAQDDITDLWEKNRAGHMNRSRYDELVAGAEAQIDADAAELAALAQIDTAPGLPPVIDWTAMTAAEQVRALTEGYKTPIKVEPGNGGGAALSAADRISLVPR